MSTQLKDLVAQPEGKTLEFKRDVSRPKNLLKTLVAFANTAGGVLLVGVEKPLDEEERLCSLIADSIEPRLVPDVKLVPWEKRTVLIVEVYPSDSRPHFLKAEGPESGVYFRLGSTSSRLRRALVRSAS